MTTRESDIKFKRWTSCQIKRRPDVIPGELDGVHGKRSRSWVVLSGPRLTDADITVAVPMTTAGERTATALLVDNGELPETSPRRASAPRTDEKKRSCIDCQQPWTVLIRRAIGAGHPLLPETPAEIAKKLDRYVASDFPPDEGLRQGTVVCCNVRPRFSDDKDSDVAAFRTVARRLLQIDPGDPDRWLLPALIVTSNRYLRFDQREQEPVLDLVTVVPLIEDDRLTGPNAPRVRARDAEGNTRWFGPVTPFFMTLHRRGHVFGHGVRIRDKHPEFSDWEVPAEVLREVVEEATRLLGATGEEL